MGRGRICKATLNFYTITRLPTLRTPVPLRILFQKRLRWKGQTTTMPFSARFTTCHGSSSTGREITQEKISTRLKGLISNCILTARFTRQGTSNSRISQKRRAISPILSHYSAGSGNSCTIYKKPPAGTSWNSRI